MAGPLDNIWGLGGYLQQNNINQATQSNQLNNAQKAATLLELVRRNQERQKIQGILAQAQASGQDINQIIPQLVGMGTSGIQAAGPLVQLQKNQADTALAGPRADLVNAQLSDLQHKSQATQDRSDATNQLSNLVATGGYSQNTPGAMPPTQVMANPDQAEAAAIAQYKKDPNTPFAIDVPNPANIRALAIKANPSLIPQVLKQMEPPLSQPLATTRAVAGGYIEKQADGTWKFNKTGVDRAEVGNAGAGGMTQDALTLAVDQYLAGDSTAAQGYARSAPMKTAFMNRLAERAKEQGINGKDLAGLVAEFQGQKSGQRALGTRQANIELAATVTKQFAPLAITASEAFDRTGFKSLNDVQKAVQSRTASPELRKFDFANTSLINAYARAVSPTGVPAVTDKEHARAILDTGFSKGDYKAAVSQLLLEINAELEAPSSVQTDMRNRFTGTPAPTPTPASPDKIKALLDKYK